MAALQVEGETNTGDVEDGLNLLRQSLRSKNLLYIVDICREFDNEITLKSLTEWRKKDILEFIDEMNNDQSNQHHIPVRKKNKFANIIAQHASSNELEVSMPLCIKTAVKKLKPP
eukprot:829242_1